MAILSTLGWRGGLLVLSCILLLTAQGLRSPRAREICFGAAIGTLLTTMLMSVVDVLFRPEWGSKPFHLALAFVGVIVLWRMLFGPWSATVKATVLGTLLSWLTVGRFLATAGSDRGIFLLAVVIAAIPTAIWCVLFLRFHRERLSVVVLTFLAGMLATAPILFYDRVLRRGIELHFFLFRLVPEHFQQSSRSFVTDLLTGEQGIHATVGVTIVSFLLVAVIEEWSKYWVTSRSDPAFFASVDDVIQLSIFAALGFAFAENIVNPNYFFSFVRDYLVEAETPKWGALIGGIVGRSVLTNTVHVVSSGVLGYFYGLAFFASPLLRDEANRGRRHSLSLWLHRLVQVRQVTIYRDEKMLEGVVSAISIHAAFDVIVTLPDVLPGRPQSLGALFGLPAPWTSLHLITLPSLLYIVGGWLLLSWLFQRQEDMKEFGHLIVAESFVSAPPVS